MAIPLSMQAIIGFTIQGCFIVRTIPIAPLIYLQRSDPNN